MVGPFDYHLPQKVLDLCRRFGIPHQRDLFRYYRSDSASALDAGNDIRTALICFGIDASHGYERVHIDALTSPADLTALYMPSPPNPHRAEARNGPVAGFPQAPGTP